ncbi:hypothetical protein HED55_04240 [Ochrobactrum haematophilum]|uniref:Uncharacterized protein n=1 Tax=Brucella haematophila TaxID=419474 RepID=A0ABX1DKB0_9HYPH|nr:hypothetical protein [Brucella haematophila]
MSGDDLLLPNSLAPRLAVLRSGSAEIVSSLPEWINERGEVLPALAHPPLFYHYDFPAPIDMFAHIYNNGNMVCAPSVAMTRSCWNTVGLFNEDLWQLQDYEYWLRACAKDQRFRCLAEPCVAYRWHGKNLSLANASASENEMDRVLLAAPEWLDTDKLTDLIWGRTSNRRPMKSSLKYYVFLRASNIPGSCKKGGGMQLRDIARDKRRRSFC